MKHGCPNPDCSFHTKNDFVIKDGKYKRKDDSRNIQRYKCKVCGRKFSTATFSPMKNQKKRRINPIICALFCSSSSHRRIAKILNINRITVKRKFEYFAMISKDKHQKFLENMPYSVTHLQFDDLITIEHTKLKPVTATIAVDADRRTILGIKVGKIPAFGHLAKISRAKYGKRKNEHLKSLNELFFQIEKVIGDNALIESDEHKLYPGIVQKYLPKAEHKRYKGGRGCIAGQGELKKLHYDPLFAINHTCAMLRDNIKRLARKTWCTTKSVEMLQKHFDIFVYYFNTQILK